MLLKLDLEKAYDRVHWDFLQETLSMIGLPTDWINLIMNCMSSNELNV